jgi:hypothetical protein
MTTARACVVLSTVAAACSAVALLRLPLFELRADALNSSITQSLFTTDIYTPLAEKHIPVKTFTEKCERLQMGFRIAQGCTIAAIACLALAFLCGVLHLTPTFTKTKRNVRCICGAPISLLLLLAVAVISVEGYVLRSMYEDNIECRTETALITGNDAVPHAEPFALHDDAAPHEGVAAVGRLSILRENRRTLSSVVSPHRLNIPPPLDLPDVPVEVVYARHAELHALAATDEKRCNPFDDCIASYRSMGFEQAVGYRVVWVVLGVAAFAALVEMMVMAVGASAVPQAGVMEETVNLLHRQDDERVI